MGNRGELILVAALLLGQLVFLAAQIQDPENNDTLLNRAATGVTTPFASAIDEVVRTGEDTVLGLRDRGRLSRDNDRLRAEVQELRKRNAAQQGAIQELRRLREAMGYTAPAGESVRLAKVVYVNHGSLLRRMGIEVLEQNSAISGAAADDSQAAEGERETSGAAVVTEEGLVGRVITTRPPYAKVQLITDRSSSVGVMVERTRRQGLLRGAGDSLMLDYLPLQADVRVGDRIVTAGIDGVYPRGVTVGTVTDVSAGDELFHDVEVAPAVNFSRLDQVFLLDNDAPPKEIMDDAVEPLVSATQASPRPSSETPVQSDSPQPEPST